MYRRRDSRTLLSVIVNRPQTYCLYATLHTSKYVCKAYKFTAPLTIVPFSDKAAVTYGQLRARLEKSGQIIGPMDLLIGSHAKAESFTLVTNNVTEFQRITDLKIENWINAT